MPSLRQHTAESVVIYAVSQMAYSMKGLRTEGNYNARQNCWDTLRRVASKRHPLPLYNAESSIFVHLLLVLVVDLNIAWWGCGRYGMLEDSVDFMSKKCNFNMLMLTQSNNTAFLRHVPTTLTSIISYTF